MTPPQMRLHNEYAEMIRANFLTCDEQNHLHPVVGTTFKRFTAPYTQSRKEPDWALLPNTDEMPSIVIETGWPQSWQGLTDKMRLWLLGGRPNVQLVFLVQWVKHTNNTVSGKVRVFERTTAGDVNERHHITVFPFPGQGQLLSPLPVANYVGLMGFCQGEMQEMCGICNCRHLDDLGRSGCGSRAWYRLSIRKLVEVDHQHHLSDKQRLAGVGQWWKCGPFWPQ